MKKRILYELLARRQNVDRGLKKKLLIGVGIFGVFVFVGGAVVTYAGFKVTTSLIGNAPTQEQLSDMATVAKDQGQKVFQGALQKNCWSEIQAHMNLSVWLSKPIAENTNKISTACFFRAESKENYNIEGVKDAKNNI
jgi:hypothetical protein